MNIADFENEIREVCEKYREKNKFLENDKQAGNQGNIYGSLQKS